MKPAAHQAVDEFFSRYPVRHYKKGQILILAGDKSPSAFYLVEGRVRIYDVTYRGEERVVNSLKPPILFPLPLIVQDRASSYIYEANTDIAIRPAPVHETLEFLQTHPQALYGLLDDLSRAYDSILERMAYVISGNAKTKLVYSLVVECREFGELQKDGSYRLVISERALGAQAGLSRETVSREARLLKVTKLIEVGHNEIIIPNLRRLEHYLELHG